MLAVGFMHIAEVFIDIEMFEEWQRLLTNDDVISGVRILSRLALWWMILSDQKPL